jgi:hypothetical protein
MRVVIVEMPKVVIYIAILCGAWSCSGPEIRQAQGIKVPVQNICNCYEVHHDQLKPLHQFHPEECDGIKELVYDSTYTERESRIIKVKVQIALMTVLSNRCNTYKTDFLAVQDEIYTSLSSLDTFDYSEYLMANPDSYLATVQKGERLISIGRYEDALIEYRSVLEDLPETFFPMSEYVYVLTKTGNVDEAVRILETPFDNETSTDVLQRSIWINALTQDHNTANQIINLKVGKRTKVDGSNVYVLINGEEV